MAPLSQIGPVAALWITGIIGNAHRNLPTVPDPGRRASQQPLHAGWHPSNCSSRHAARDPDRRQDRHAVIAPRSRASVVRDVRDTVSATRRGLVIENCWRSPREFPLLDLLEGTPTPHAKDDVRAYFGRSVPGVNVDQIVYFAASLFWRGGAHAWSGPKGQTNNAPPDRIYLGPYLEPLRIFLLGKGPFPAYMYLSAWLEFKRDERENRHVVPPFKAFDTGYHIFRMFIPGLAFTLSVGKGVGGEIQRTCTARSGLLVICPTEGLRNTEVRARVMESEMKGKLAALFPKSSR